MNDMTRPQNPLPLTMGQMDFWEEFLAHPVYPVSTVAHATSLEGALDEAALIHAIERVIAETDVLSLRFSAGEPPVQTVEPSFRPRLHLRDLRDQPDPEAEARALMQADIDAPLPLIDAALSAVWLLRLSESRWIWYLRGHHIFLDGYSMALIERRVAKLYAELIGGAEAGPAFGRFADYIAEEMAYQASLAHDKAAAFWTGYLDRGGLPASLQKGAEDYPAAPRSARIALDHLSPDLRDAAKRFALGWPDLLIMASALWLWKSPPSDGEERDEACVWLPIMGRMGSVSANIPAMALNILPLRLSPDPAATLGETLLALSRDLAQLRRHGRYRIEQIGRDVGLPEDRRFFFSPLINVMPFDPAVFPGGAASREVLAAGPGDGFNITISADSRANGLAIELDADPILTSEVLFADHVTGLPLFLAEILSSSSDKPLAELL